MQSENRHGHCGVESDDLRKRTIATGTVVSSLAVCMIFKIATDSVVSGLTTREICKLTTDIVVSRLILLCRV